MPYAKINQPKAFMETVLNFTSPCEAIREALQDSVDAGAQNIWVDVTLVETADGQPVNIVIRDDGSGIEPGEFSHFFDLADSTKNEADYIGYLGLGSAIYFNSDRVTLESWVNGQKYVSVSDKPYATLFQNQLVEYSEPELVPNTEGYQHGTRVTIESYLKSTGEKYIDHYSHPALKDYIQWFTVFASFKGQFEKLENPPKLYLRTFDSNEKALQKEFCFNIVDGYEEIPYGHVFPDREMTAPEELKRIAVEERVSRWDEFFCKRVFCEEVFIDGLSKPVQIVIWLEGDQCKKRYNKMIRDNLKPTSIVRGTMYKTQDRYGFWAGKKYIPIQRIDNMINGKGSYTKYHAMVNYDDFSLTSNRSSIDNTNQNTIRKIKDKLNVILAELQKTKEFKEMKDSQVSADNERGAENEDAAFAKRLKKSKARKSVVLGNVRYYEPTCEGETAILLDGILQTYPECFNFEILDYNTNCGIDFLVREQPGIPIENDSTVGFVELKYTLDKTALNHSFTKLRGIVLYDKKGIKPSDILVDLTGKKLMLQKVNGNLVLADYLGEVGHSINLYVIKDFMEAKEIQMA